MILETARTLLRPFADGDAQDLYDYARDPRVGPAVAKAVAEAARRSGAARI